jgi:hypothetical protein
MFFLSTLGLGGGTLATIADSIAVRGSARGAAVGATLSSGNGLLLIISIVIVILINVHLPSSRLVRRGRLRARSLLLDRSVGRGRSRRRAVRRRGRSGALRHGRKARSTYGMRRHVLNRRQGRRVVSRLRRVVVLIGSASILAASFGGTASLHLTRRRQTSRGTRATAVLVIQASPGLITGLLLDRTSLTLPFTSTLHSRRGTVIATLTSSGLSSRS